MQWSYGVLTVPSRKDGLFPDTVASLSAAGFPNPRLFIDGAEDGREYSHIGSPASITCHSPAVGIFSNWLLALWELFYQSPHADRYVLFEDDIIACKNLRQYLELTGYPLRGFCNLYTWPQNEMLFSKHRGTEKGWCPSLQRGQGAVALMFDNYTASAILTNHQFIEQAKGTDDERICIDGGIMVTMKNMGWKEYVHSPSLVQHVGMTSVLGHDPFPQSTSFPGDEFDALELVG